MYSSLQTPLCVKQKGTQRAFCQLHPVMQRGVRALETVRGA